MELECFELEHLGSPITFAYQSSMFGTLDIHNDRKRAMLNVLMLANILSEKNCSILTNWSKHILCNKWPQSGMWHGILEVWISPKHTGQFDRDIFSTHWNCQHIFFNQFHKKFFYANELPYVLQFSIELAGTYYTLHNGRNCFCHLSGIFRIHDNGTGLYLHRQIDYISNMCTASELWFWKSIYSLGFFFFFEITLPNRTLQFSHSACTFCRVSHFVQINSVNVFLSKWWSSFSSWQ